MNKFSLAIIFLAFGFLTACNNKDKKAKTGNEVSKTLVDSLEAGAEDFGQECAVLEAQRDDAGGERLEVDPQQHREAIIEPEQEYELRNAAKELDIEIGEPAQRPERRHARESHDESDRQCDRHGHHGDVERHRQAGPNGRRPPQKSSARKIDEEYAQGCAKSGRETRPDRSSGARASPAPRISWLDGRGVPPSRAR